MKLLNQSCRKQILGSVRKKSAGAVRREVWVSSSSCIFANLALEDLLYRRGGFQDRELVLLYRNRPCVVIGRHQNPWVEASLPELRRRGVTIARRNSGGGTVYHDLGNLNLSFLTSKARYDRAANLRLLCRVVKDGLGMELEVNDRDDVMLGTRKVSGTAAKLGRESAYHHCTLLLGVDTSHLHSCLTSQAGDMIQTNATPSVRCPVENLTGGEVEGAVASLVAALRREVGQEEGEVVVVPTDLEFPGLGEVQEQLQSWEWIFGKTPKFTISRGAQQILVEKGLVASTSHLLHPGVPEVQGLRLEPDLATRLEDTYTTALMAAALRRIL